MPACRAPGRISSSSQRSCSSGWERAADQVAILRHESEDDFIVELLTKSRDDRLILARMEPSATLKETAAMVLERIEGAKPIPWGHSDTLVAPSFDFDLTARFEELKGRAILGHRAGNMPLGEAVQSIRFRLDERGATLRSEAAQPAATSKPRYMILDGPFLILLVRKGAKKPYFALWVDNAELMVAEGGAGRLNHPS